MIKKIWRGLIHLDLPYAHLINSAINRFSQEIIDFNRFENNSFNSFMSPEETMELLSQTLNTKQCTLFENTSLEFCITNDYNIDGKRWNCIEHLVEHHHNLFSKQDIKYLQAINNSYASIYKVTLLEDGLSIELSNMLEESQTAIISGKKQVQNLSNHQLIATRVLKTGVKKKAVNKISNTLLPFTEGVCKSSVKAINSILAERNSSLSQNELLLYKKMMIKKILEQWYLYTQKRSIVYH